MVFIMHSLVCTVETAVKKLLVSTCTARVTTAYLACVAFNDITICDWGCKNRPCEHKKIADF